MLSRLDTFPPSTRSPRPSRSRSRMLILAFIHLDEIDIQVATHGFGQRSGRVMIMLQRIQCRTDVIGVTPRRDSAGEAEHVHVDDRDGIEHEDGRERELGSECGSVSFTKFKARVPVRTSGICGYTSTCRSNILIVSHAVLTHSSARPSMNRPVSIPAWRLSRPKACQTLTCNNGSKQSVLTWRYIP